MYQTSARQSTLDFLFPPTPSSSLATDHRRDAVGLHTYRQLTPPYSETTPRKGLRTPPADDMTTTYQQTQYRDYAGRQDGAYGMPGASRSGYVGTYPPAANMQPKTYPASGQHPPVSASTLRHEIQASSALQHVPPPSPQPVVKSSLAPKDKTSVRKSSVGDMTTASLQIPSSINNSGGSLAEFAAQVTCLFWFESTEALKKAESFSSSSSPVKRLRTEALPSSGFRKWVATILSTTQVTQNVILLALLFIYRLKTINPAVKGRSGSEYRLLTVALMLGNKFLDDNTYTNKTWAEVSGISVTEIHVMEVEFLSNMRYSLLASKEQWQEWQEKLGKFWAYCDRAANLPPSPSPQIVSGLQPTLPSPPTSMQASPPTVPEMYPSLSGPIGYNQNLPASNYAAPMVPRLTSMPELNVQPRKRSYEDSTDEPAPKRVTRQNGMVPLHQEPPRLPVPSLTISTTQPFVNGGSAPTSFSQNVLLPPLGGRAMSTVYPSTPAWQPQLPMLTPTGPSNPQGASGSSGYVTPSRRHSPHSVHDLLSLGSSPISANFPSHNPGHISPSFYLQQRASPYKPVRHVNALLYPPPSTSMHDYSMNIEQMHYLPLGKRHDMRSGVVPDYTIHAAYQQWPPLPQPNFHS